MPVLIPKHSMLHPHGAAIFTPDDGGRPVIHDTIQCVHCGAHGAYRAGCGNKLGFCQRCNGHTCPNPKCAPENCLGPQEARVELFEQGKILEV